MSHFIHGFVAELETAKTLETSMDVLAGYVSSLGFPRVLYAYTPVPRAPDGHLCPPPVICRNFPTGWKRHWNEVNEHDPYYKACFESTLPIDWRELRSRKRLTAAEQRACRYMDDYGMPRGITVPIHLPNGAFAGMSAIWKENGSDGEWSELAARARDAIFLVAHHFHYCVHARFHASGTMNRPRPRLTPREIECLEWVAAGKSSLEIGIILGCSGETVRFHLKNAMRKLSAVNRAQASIKACHLGLIKGTH